MGLDITAYRQASIVADYEHLVTRYPGETFFELSNEYRATHTEVREFSDFMERANGIVPGIYAITEQYGFHAGSYSGYRDWREHLAELAGYPAISFQIRNETQRLHAASCWAGAEGPFSELINFSDCEGYIGPRTSAKLAEDFNKHRDEIVEKLNAKNIFEADGGSWHRQYFFTTYDSFSRAFAMAADGGFVKFS